MEETRHRVPMTDGKDNYVVSAPLARGIVVLVYIWHHPGASLNDIHRGVSIPKSSLVRILRTLMAGGVVSRASDGTYWRGPVFSEVNVRDVELLKVRCHPVIEELARHYGETVGLFWIDGNSRVCVDAVESSNEVRRILILGQRKPLDVGCTAAAAMSFSRTLKLPRVIPQYTPDTVTSHEEIESSWEIVRRQGFAVTHNQTFRGVSGVAAPIIGPMGEPIAVISITGPKERFCGHEVEELGKRLVFECQKLSRELTQSDWGEVQRHK